MRPTVGKWKPEPVWRDGVVAEEEVEEVVGKGETQSAESSTAVVGGIDVDGDGDLGVLEQVTWHD